MKLFNLVKINLLSYFNFYKLFNARSMSERMKEIFKFLLLAFVALIFGWYIYMFAKLTMNGLEMLNIEYVVLGEFFALGSLFSLFSTIFKVDSILFSSKDYEMLQAMPIRKTTIVGSKMLNLYFSNLLFIFLIMIPVLLLYVSKVAVTTTFLILYVLSIFIIPLLPTLLAVVIGSLVSIVSSKFRLKKAIQFILLTILVVGAFYFSYIQNKGGELQIANFGSVLVETFNHYYPLTKTYMKMLMETDVISMLLFIILPVILYFLATLLISLVYTNVVSALNEGDAKKKYKLQERNMKSPVMAMFKKEFLRYITSPNYVFNTSLGVIMLLVGGIALFFISPLKLEEILGVPNLTSMITHNAPFLTGLVLMMSCTTSSSISLEGKNLWIVKSLPISPIQVFQGKILLNFVLLFIPGIFISVIFTVILHLNALNFLLLLLTVVCYALFISLFGLVINLHFPLMEWKSEIKVIKQSMSTFITMFGGIILGMIPLLIETSMNENLYLLFVDVIILSLSLLLFLYLQNVGVKLFAKINA